MMNNDIRGTSQLSLPRSGVSLHPTYQSERDGEDSDPLFIAVVRQRWTLLVSCLLFSLLIATVVAMQLELPKAETVGKLRYVPLPPTLSDVYQPPGPLELSEVLRSNQYMAQLAQRMGLDLPPRDLAERFDVKSSRFSNIIQIKLKWSDAQQAIGMVNALMEIARDATIANRNGVLGKYQVDAEAAYRSAEQHVLDLREELTRMRQQRDSELQQIGGLDEETAVLMARVARAEDLLDQKTFQRSSMTLQIDTLKNDVAALAEQIKELLAQSRRQQIELRRKVYKPDSPHGVRLLAVQQELDRFLDQSKELDYAAWRAKMESLGRGLLGPLDLAVVSAADGLAQKLSFKTQKIEQLQLDLLPLDGEIALLDRRYESLQRRLADTLGAVQTSAVDVEEAESQLEAATRIRSRIHEQLDHIRRLRETEFAEMTVMTPASWQTTEVSRGKAKLFVVTLAGSLFLLTVPVFVLEHFFPSGDPAERAARSLQLPLVSRNTLVSRGSSGEGDHQHACNNESLRLLALRIQQSVRRPGAMVLFSSLNGDACSLPTIGFLADCLARREEKVLIIDASDGVDSVNTEVGQQSREQLPFAEDTNQAGPTSAVSSGQRGASVGLSEFFRQRDLCAEDLICPTSTPGVDMIPHGVGEFPPESLAASCLTHLLQECSHRYTLVLVAGPATTRPSDLQMLAARADGILFAVDPSGYRFQGGEEVVRDLIGLGAPVIGIVG